jgi:aromatic ring-cleaving dioxygenase
VNTAGIDPGQLVENHIHVYIDGRQVQHTVERQQLQVGARRGQSYQPYKR